MNLSQEIKKAECKLIKKIYKYSNLLAFGIYRHCLHNEILTLKLLIAALKGYNNPDCKVECDIKGQYEFELPNGEIGYIEFGCNNKAYLIVNGEISSFVYDYYNNQITYDVGGTTPEIESVNTVNFLLTPGFLISGYSYFIYVEDDLVNPIMTGNIPTILSGSLLGIFLENFNQFNSLGLTITFVNGNLIVLNPDGSNYEGILTFIFTDKINNSTEYLSEIVSSETEVPSMYNSPITFDECCNITGEFDFNLYCYNDPLEFNINGLTLNWEDYIIKITIDSYVLEILPEQYTGFQSIIDLWNETYPEIYLTGNSDEEGNCELIFYSPKTLELCDDNIELELVKGLFTPAYTEYDFSGYELPPIAFILQISVNSDIIFSTSFDTDSLLEFLNDLVADFNAEDNGYTMSLNGETLIITTPNGEDYNGLIFEFRLGIGDDIIDDIEFPETQGGANPLPDNFEGEFNENWVVNNLTNIEECKPEIINCLKPEEIEIITEKINKL
jgi:hypothetical protein